MFGLIWALTACRAKHCLAACDSALLQCRKAKANTPNHLSGADRPFRHTIDFSKGIAGYHEPTECHKRPPRLVIQARRVSPAPEGLWLLRPNGHPWHPPQGPFPRFLRRIHEIRPKPARAMPNRPSVEGSGMGIIAGTPPARDQKGCERLAGESRRSGLSWCHCLFPPTGSLPVSVFRKTRLRAHGQLQAIFIPREFISHLQ